MAALSEVVGVGPVTACTLVSEFYAWRDFRNRREVGGATGLTGTPYDTGESDREQGISKAGNRRVRRVAVELAWSWVRLQPESASGRRFLNKYSGVGPRQRRKGIVGLGRRLVIELWRLAAFGVVPDGARLRSERRLAQAA